MLYWQSCKIRYCQIKCCQFKRNIAESDEKVLASSHALFFLFLLSCICEPTCKHTLPPKHACTQVHTHALTHTPIFLWEGQSSELACHSLRFRVMCVCVRVRVRLIQVLSRREDKNLLPASSLVGPLNLPTGERLTPTTFWLGVFNG